MNVPPSEHVPKTCIAEVVGGQRNDCRFDANRRRLQWSEGICVWEGDNMLVLIVLPRKDLNCWDVGCHFERCERRRK